MTRYAVLHGHFYQPPREEPWLELVPREPTAAPYHDWNERITAECYRPLAHAPVLDGADRIEAVYNAYAHCSLDVGPTLFRWFDHHAPEVGAAIVAGDKASVERTGFGTAIAAPYHHVILPLAARRDKTTEVRWGIRDFVERFGRTPQGMWLPETAVDEETLEVLIEEGIRYTILAPHQVSAPATNGHPVRWVGATGTSIAIFTYDGPLSNDIAFTELMRDSNAWADRFTHGDDRDESQVVMLATDGETFGHHHKGGDRALASVIHRLARRDDVTLTTLDALLERVPPAHDVTLNAPTSWSCAHGIERWRIECGCRMVPGTSQAWRAPLRAGLEMVKSGVHAVVEREWPAEAGDLWQAREAAGADLEGVRAFPVAARRLLEAEHHALAMFTSCGWFFDDLGRIEPRLILRHAARALEFLPGADAEAIEAALLGTLAEAHSNDPEKGSGVDIWHRDVLREADGPARLAAGVSAIRDFAPDLVNVLSVPSHTWRLEGDTIVTVHRRTGREMRWATTPVVLGIIADRVHVRDLDSGAEQIVSIDRYPSPVRTLLAGIVRAAVLGAAAASEATGASLDGPFTPEAARWRTMRGAWALVARDGLGDADIVVHAAIDLHHLDEAPVPDELRAEAFTILAPMPESRARQSLAERLGLLLPNAS